MIRSLLLVPFLAAATALAAPASRPNILFVITDDQSYPHAGAYGCPWVTTPAFDRVAREGLLFTRAYTPNAKCAPSRAIVLTGRNSWQLEEAGNHISFFPAKFRGFMEALAAHGYFTGHTGKGWGPGDPGTIDGRRRELTGRAFDQIKTRPPVPQIGNVDYAANFAAFLREKPAGQPFCFWLGTLEPHRRYQPGSGVKLGGKSTAQIDRVPLYWPDNETVRSDMLDYAYEIEYADRHLGRVLETLAQAGELEDTLIVVTGDNGMPFPRAKGTTYEISNHMPLAIRWGRGIAKPGRTVEDYVSFTDFAPTFLEVAGLPAADSGMQPFAGRSLVGIFRDAAPVAGRVQPGRDHLVLGQERHDVGRPGNVGYPARGLYRDGFLYVRNFAPDRFPMGDPHTGYLNSDGGPTKTLLLEQNRRGLDHWRWELNFGRRPAEELYDVKADPDCVTNLAAEPAHQARREAMWAELAATLTAQGDPRMEGKGEVFDRYPLASNAHFWEDWTAGKRQKTNWVNDSDYEDPEFDPERPLRPREDAVR